MNIYFYMFIIFLVEHLQTCVSLERLYVWKSRYYPYKKPHESIYLKNRRQHDYDNDDQTNSLYLPNFNQNVTTDQSPTTSGYTASSFSSSSSFLDPSTLKTTNGPNVSTFVRETTTEIEITTSNMTPEKSTSSITDSYNTTLEEFNETERLVEDSSVSNSVTYTLISPPTFEAYSPGATEERNVSNVLHTTTQNPIVKEIKEWSRKDGYFTASAIVLLQTLASLNASHVKCLLASLNFQIERLENKEQLFHIFAGGPEEVVASTLQALATEPNDVMINQFQYTVYGLENRETFLKEDTNTLLDIVNTVYLERDGEDIAGVIEEVKSSNCSNTKTVARDLLKAFILTPFERVQGTAREQVISTGIEHIMQMRFRDASGH